MMGLNISNISNINIVHRLVWSFKYYKILCQFHQCVECFLRLQKEKKITGELDCILKITWTINTAVFL